MVKILKIIFTPVMFLLALTLLILGWFYFMVLVKMYDFAWGGWND